MEQPSVGADVVRITVPFVSGEIHQELLKGTLVYDRLDPFAVRMSLEAHSGTIVWTFARELLAEGLYAPTGDGDVHVWPCLSSEAEAVVVIELTSPDGKAMLHAPARLVHDFVAATVEVVGLGQESAHLPIDSLISRLLAG